MAHESYSNPVTHSASGLGTKAPALLAVAFGVLLVFGTGLAQSSAFHNAAHDTRHSTGMPCH